MFNRTLEGKKEHILKRKILNDLDLKKNLCFNQIVETEDMIHITKSKTPVSSTIEIKEICDIQRILARYQKNNKITISLDEVIIKLN